MLDDFLKTPVDGLNTGLFLSKGSKKSFRGLKNSYL